MANAPRVVLVACSIGTLLAPCAAVGQGYHLVVAGQVLEPASGATDGNYAPKGGVLVGLYTARIAMDQGRLTTAPTANDGIFVLTTKGGRGLAEAPLWVIHEDRLGWAADPQRVPAPTETSDPNLIKANVKPLRLRRLIGLGPSDAADAVVAVGRTHQVKAWAGVESVTKAESAVKDAIARLEEGMTDEARKRFTAALYDKATPLGSSSADGLPALAALAQPGFADVFVAAAPTRRWLIAPQARQDEADRGYGEFGERFEGSVVTRVGAAFSLVSVTSGRVPLDPGAQKSVALTWPGPISDDVCLEANPLDPGVRWRMRTVIRPNERAFEWDLSRTRDSGLARDSVGFLARPCRSEGPQAVHLPVRIAGLGAPAPTYRIAFVSPDPLRTVDPPKLFWTANGTEREIPAPAVSVSFDKRALSPLVVVEVSAAGLESGVLRLEMRGRGPSGAFGPNSVSFVHENVHP